MTESIIIVSGIVLIIVIATLAVAMIVAYYVHRLRQARARAKARKEARARAMNKFRAIKAFSSLGGAKGLAALAVNNSGSGVAAEGGGGLKACPFALPAGGGGSQGGGGEKKAIMPFGLPAPGVATPRKDAALTEATPTPPSNSLLASAQAAAAKRQAALARKAEAAARVEEEEDSGKQGTLVAYLKGSDAGAQPLPRLGSPPTANTIRPLSPTTAPNHLANNQKVQEKADSAWAEFRARRQQRKVVIPAISLTQAPPARVRPHAHGDGGDESKTPGGNRQRMNAWLEGTDSESGSP